MEYPRVKRRTDKDELDRGAYASLDELIRLQFKATGFSFLPKQPVHSILAGRHASRLRGRGLNFEEIRKYIPGDDIRNMDWKVTNRMREPHVRAYSEERDRPVLLVVDQRSSMFFGSRRVMKSVCAAEAAALGAWRVTGAGDRVGAIVFGDEKLSVIRPQRSNQTVLQILREVVDQNHSLNAQPGQADFEQKLNVALERASKIVTHDWLVCIVSDFTGTDDKTREWITRIGEHNDVMAILVYDQMGRTLPDTGRFVASDGDLQLDIDTSDRKVRKNYTQQFDDLLDEIRSFLRSREVPILPIETSRDVAIQIREILGRAQG